MSLKNRSEMCPHPPSRSKNLNWLDMSIVGKDLVCLQKDENRLFSANTSGHGDTSLICCCKTRLFGCRHILVTYRNFKWLIETLKLMRSIVFSIRIPLGILLLLWGYQHISLASPSKANKSDSLYAKRQVAELLWIMHYVQSTSPYIKEFGANLFFQVPGKYVLQLPVYIWTMHW